MDDKIRFIPTMIHGAVDYVFGLALIGLAYFYGWSGIQFGIGAGAGIAVIVYSLLTDYELGVVRFFSVKTHLIFDLIIGIVLIAAPFAFHFLTGSHRWPFVVFGAAAIFFFLTTKKMAVGTAVPKV